MDEKALLDAIRQIVREELQPVNERLDKLEQGQQEIKDFIVKNNVAIGEVLTQALEDAEEPKNTVYKIIPLKG